ncbi:hypothetical protein AMATHDRAFT_277 [Amanita thiersii Skay4041]|uniref:GYF domain-containing protein n=1 Tax=Amanita thiersii Skay4041 TaxID=703135 RepID=A0A2A9NUS3_9AGAR|nr:hypothetical protein AMATHDRAFT_277 [Amanita thiersii Skay4041]
MHFGPEWMRTKHRPHKTPSPPPSTYSPLLSTMSPLDNPFRYSKHDLLRIYKDAPSKRSLPLDVERWDGVVRDFPSDPVSLREMDDTERKLFAGSLNSEMRRRQSTDYPSSLSTQSLSADRARLNHSNSVTNSPLRERFGALRRRDSTAPLPRKQSLSSLQTQAASPRDVGLPSPRTRVGLAPNFDGVLNSGDSWVARRRASEVSLKSAIAISREPSGDPPYDGRANEIREEGEEDQEDLGGAVQKNSAEKQDTRRVMFPPQSKGAAPQEPGPADNEPSNLDDYATRSDGNTFNQVNSDVAAANGPPGLQDLANVEWSYKDPTGQVQGPFRASLMQKWYDDGYFSPDLPMMRTYLDSHWTTVEDLMRRASGDKIFLSPPLPVAPPGLSRRTESPLQSYPSTDHNTFVSLNQPSPVRTLRSSTLDSYLTSNSNPSDSPPSSFGAGRFSNDSPDPLAFGGRGGNSPYFNGDPTANGRINRGHVGDPPVPYGTQRITYNDVSLEPAIALRTSPYPNVTSTRASTTESYTLNGGYHAGPYTPALDSLHPRGLDTTAFNAYNQTSAGLGPGILYHNLGSNHDGPFHDVLPRNTPYPQHEYGTLNSLGGQRLGFMTDEVAPSFSQYGALTGASPRPIGSGQVPFLQSSSSYTPQINQAPSANSPLDQNLSIISEAAIPIADRSNQSSWRNVTETPLQRRPGPFDPSHPTSTNTMVLPLTRAASQEPPWGNNDESAQISQLKQTAPWVYKSIMSDDWKEESEHDRLTFSNVGQHNQQYESVAKSTGSIISTSTPLEPVNLPPEAVEHVDTRLVPVAEGSRWEHSKSVSQVNQDTGPTVPSLDSPTRVEPPTPAPAPPLPKAAWVKEEDVKKTKGITPTISLREIQEAESKKIEARKAADRASRLSSPTPADAKDDVQPFTTSWGLPSSQAGARSTSTPKEISSISISPVTIPPAPVWTNAVKTPTAVKSMKEIQEEEERRKKLVAKESVASVATRKTHAETVNKSLPAIANQGGAWTIVGANGKPAAPAAVTSAKTPIPSASAVISSSTPSSRHNGASNSRIAVASAPPKPTSTTTPKADDFPTAPSHEFLRWLTDSLKGLNHTVNVEEIVSMLLSFPLDPDPSTVELISDLIYTNSTTLDGRRFAAEFISKRKSDAASRAKTTGPLGKGSVKPISIADVVKAAPKSTQSEWAFKVVNKKKKGGK